MDNRRGKCDLLVLLFTRCGAAARRVGLAAAAAGSASIVASIV